MPRSNYYVDPVSGSDSTGDGLSHATAWKTTQKALNTITRNATDGDQININSSGADTLAATLSFATYGSPTVDAPLTFQGYTATARDGGIFHLNGDGNKIINDSALSYISFSHGKFSNAGTGAMLTIYRYYSFDHCEFDGSGNAAQFVVANNFCHFRLCYFHNSITTGSSTRLHASGYSVVESCVIVANGAGIALVISIYSSAVNNIIWHKGTGHGISVIGDSSSVFGNTFYTATSSNYGIYMSSSMENISVNDNYVEGFGTGIRVDSGGKLDVYGSNYFFNCTTAEDLVDGVATTVSGGATGNTTLTASGLTDPANGDFRPNSRLRNTVPDYWKFATTPRVGSVGAVHTPLVQDLPIHPLGTQVIPAGSASRYAYFVAVDDDDDHAVLTGLTSSSFTAQYSRNGSKSVTIPTVTVVEVGAVKQPGVYAILVCEDTVPEKGHRLEPYHLTVSATGMRKTEIPIRLENTEGDEDVPKRRIIMIGQHNVTLTVKVYEADRVTARDVSAYDTFSLLISKEGGKPKELTGASAGTAVEDVDYSIQLGDFDSPGIWRVVPHVIENTGSIDYFGPWEEIEVRHVSEPVPT